MRVTVDEDGNAIGYDDYYPFGKVMPGRSSNNANPNDVYKFTGHEFDQEANLDLIYAGARYMDPEIGRWLGVDPLADEFPHVSPYTYVENDPVGYFDPNGKYRVSPNGRNVYRISRTAANIQKTASYIPGIAAANVIYKSLHNDPSYPVTFTDFAAIAIGGIARMTGRVALNGLRGLNTVDAKIASAFIKSNRIAGPVGLNLAINTFSNDAKLALDEAAFGVASKLGLGNQNIVNNELFQVNESLLNGLNNEQASEIVNSSFGNIVDGLRSLAVDKGFDLATDKGVQGFLNTVRNLDEDELDQFGVEIEDGSIQLNK